MSPMEYDLASRRYTEREFCIARACNGGTWCGRPIVDGEQVFPSVEAAAGMPGNVCRGCWESIHNNFCYRNNEVLGPYSLSQALSKKSDAEALAYKAALVLEQILATVAIVDDRLMADIKEIVHHKERSWLWTQMGEPIGECSVLFSMPLIKREAYVHRGWTDGTPVAVRATMDSFQIDLGVQEPEGSSKGKFPNICRISMRVHHAEVIRDFINKMLDPNTIIPCEIRCPNEKCYKIHVDVGEWATKPHRTHLCEACGKEWRPSERYTVGVPWEPQ